MKPVRFFLFALLFASIAFAEQGSNDKSHYFGGRFAIGMDYVWNNAPVKGSFGSAKDGVEKLALGSSPGSGIGISASYMYRLNSIVGFVGEAEFRVAWFRLDSDVYGLPPKDPSGDQTNFDLYIYSFAFPVLVRVVPTSKYYLEAGAQFNLNIDGDITPASEDCDDSYDFEAERFSWSLVLGMGLNLDWYVFLGVRLVMDMTRIEKEGIVEMTRGAAYRESSPMKLWSLQFSVTGYFL